MTSKLNNFILSPKLVTRNKSFHVNKFFKANKIFKLEMMKINKDKNKFKIKKKKIRGF